jgi:NADH:ubiquinone oxidoreductase subunit 3 (subunit A)
MRLNSKEKMSILHYLIIIFIAFVVIDTIIRFYFHYFLSFDKSPITLVLSILPYFVLAGVIYYYYMTRKRIALEHRNFLKRQLKRGGLPVRRKIHVTRTKMKLKN